MVVVIKLTNRSDPRRSRECQPRLRTISGPRSGFVISPSAARPAQATAVFSSPEVSQNRFLGLPFTALSACVPMEEEIWLVLTAHNFD